MRFMNDYDIARAARIAERNALPVMAEAVRQVAIVAQWADQNSDGWCYWPKPVRACAKLMILIEGVDPFAPADLDPAAVRKALAPVKAFRTRQGADFQVVAA